MQRLRERAEHRRTELEQLDFDAAPTQLQRIMQEMQVQQIELEMQYEELLTAHAEAENLRARYTDLFDFAPVGYASIDVLGMVQELNLCGAKMLGTTRHRLTNRRFLQFIAPDSRPEFLRFMIDVLATDDPITLEVEMLRADDTRLRVCLHGIALPDPKGTRLCRLAMIDVSAEHQARTERVQGEERFQAYLDASPDGMLLLRGNHVAAANARAAALFGVATPHDLTSRHLATFAPPVQPGGESSSSRAAFDEAVAAAVRAGHARFDWQARPAATADELTLEVTLTAIDRNGPAVVLATCRDLTELRRTEQRQRAATDDLLHLSLRAAERGLWTWDPTTDRLYLDERAQQTILGPTRPAPARATLATLLEALHPDDRQQARLDITGALHTPEPVQMGWRAVWPDGSEHYVATLGHAV